MVAWPMKSHKCEVLFLPLLRTSPQSWHPLFPSDPKLLQHLEAPLALWVMASRGHEQHECYLDGKPAIVRLDQATQLGDN